MTRVICVLRFELSKKLFVERFKLNFYLRKISTIAQAVLKNQQSFDLSKHKN